MNGRIYDPEIGRFLSADPFVQFPESTQGFNRYTYVGNNPLSYTDPSGYFKWSKFRDKWLKPIAAVALAVATYGAVSGYLATAIGNTMSMCLTTTPWLAAAGGGAAAGFVAGGVMTESFDGAVKGAVAGAITGGVGGSFGNTYDGWRVASEAFAGGVAAEVTGSEFNEGFKFAFVMAAGNAVAMKMRASMIEQSKLDPRNASGKSAGFKGDGFKLGGGRAPAQVGMPHKPSPLGGIQGGQGELFGAGYSPGSTVDLIVEAYAGPHDWLNSGYWYDSVGNIPSNLSTTEKVLGEILNAANVALATPIVVTSVIPSSIYVPLMNETKED